MNVTTRPIETPEGVRDLACTQDVSDTLGVALPTTLVINRLGVPADFHRRSAYYWTPENVQLIRDRLVEHLQAL